jgi:radical SAM protein with 4Fe4S-binding SPASM domain
MNQAAPKVIHQEPGGRVKLVAYQDRFQEAMTDCFGRRFLDYRAMWEKSSRFDFRPKFPLSLDLEVNASCNFRCIMCPMGEVFPGNDVPYGTMMGLDLYQKLMDQAKEQGLPAMTFGYLSEPLLHPALPEMIAMARKAGVMDIRLGTNGALMSREMGHKLIEAGLTRLEVSLDAYRPETFRRIRRGGRIDRVVHNILDFLEIRQKAGSDFPVLRLSFLRLPYNEKEIEPFMAFWKDKADLFSIQEPLYYHEAPIAKKLSFTAEPADPDFRCAQPWQRLIVRADGQAFPCCSLYGLKLKMGSAWERSIKDLWDQAGLEALRRLHKAGKYRQNPACRLCADRYAVRAKPLKPTEYQQPEALNA